MLQDILLFSRLVQESVSLNMPAETTPCLPPDGYRYERLEARHHKDLQDLFYRVFRDRPGREAFLKKYETNRLGKAVTGFVAIHIASGDLVAFYGVFPLQIDTRKEIIQGAQSGDTMTDPRHRRMGFFVHLAQLTYEACRREGIRLLIGQPNEQSYHGLVHTLRWEPMDEIVRFDLKTRWPALPWPKLALRLGLFRSLYLPLARRILKKRMATAPTAFSNPLPDGAYRVHRDAAYLQYKEGPERLFLNIDNKTYWVRLHDVFFIGEMSDYDFFPEKKWRRLAWWLGYNTISFALNGSLPRPAALKNFQAGTRQASCFLYLDNTLEKKNMVLTGADSDSW